MRRKDREILDKLEIYEIMKKCDSCNVAFFDRIYPYIVPMNFGVELSKDNYTLYFHGAYAGTKVELMKTNPHVAFEMDCNHKILLDEIACKSTMEYESVCGNGIIEIVPEEDKIEALNILMGQYQDRKDNKFKLEELSSVCVLRIRVNSISAKRLIRKG
ncbi:MAG: pyridoxamine 5'-phosphate oxidase family protein [Lachnospiraceae bacterium]|nr:pyridoxamine 5'-phosphate oxidase family protein [Lachnospiraceae bacterium]